MNPWLPSTIAQIFSVSVFLYLGWMPQTILYCVITGSVAFALRLREKELIKRNIAMQVRNKLRGY